MSFTHIQSFGFLSAVAVILGLAYVDDLHTSASNSTQSQSLELHYQCASGQESGCMTERRARWFGPIKGPRQEGDAILPASFSQTGIALPERADLRIAEEHTGDRGPAWIIVYTQSTAAREIVNFHSINLKERYHVTQGHERNHLTIDFEGDTFVGTIDVAPIDEGSRVTILISSV